MRIFYTGKRKKKLVVEVQRNWFVNENEEKQRTELYFLFVSFASENYINLPAASSMVLVADQYHFPHKASKWGQETLPSP